MYRGSQKSYNVIKPYRTVDDMQVAVKQTQYMNTWPKALDFGQIP